MTAQQAGPQVPSPRTPNRLVRGSVPRGMVLPPVDGLGYVQDAWRVSLADTRVPRPFDGTDGEVRATGSSSRCADGQPRHLWDILETTEWRETEDERGEWIEEAKFREVLTCVHCGLVAERRGTRRDKQLGRLDVEAMRSGSLVAQQVKVVQFFNSADASYIVYDGAGEDVGRITWSAGPRGRRFYVGKLGDDGVPVEGPTAAAVLRKLAKAAS